MATAVKICGITRVEDALAAARAGAYGIGLVFYAPSPRHVALAQARDIVAALPPFVTTVGVFVDPAEEEVRKTLAEGLGMDLVVSSPEALQKWTLAELAKWGKIVKDNSIKTD